MTNPIAVVLGLIIIGAICIDVYMYDTQYLLFWAKKMAEFIEWLAFWR